MEECGKRQSKKAQVGSLHNMSRNDMIDIIEKEGVKGIRRLKRQQLCELVISLRKSKNTKKEKTIKSFLRYDGSNSCYIDSTLVSLFNTNPKWVRNIIGQITKHKDKQLKKVVIDIQSELKGIYRRMYADDPEGQSAFTCKALRRLFRAFENEYERVYNAKGESMDWVRSQQEPTDIMNLLMRVFDIHEDIHIQVNDYPRMAFFNAPYVPASDLKANEHGVVLFKDYFPVYNDATRTTYRSAKVVCFNVERNFLNEKVNTIFKFPSKVYMADGHTELELRSIIIHHGRDTRSGHYTCMLKMGSSKWYHYDDMSSTILIGSFKEMLSWKNEFVLRNCTNLFYTKKKQHKKR
jgi:hypothetical protein